MYNPPRAITPDLLSNVQAMYQNRQITHKEKNELTTMIRNGLVGGYDQLIEKLKYLEKVIPMNFLATEMLERIGVYEVKEEHDIG